MYARHHTELTKAYSEPCKTSKKELFEKIVNDGRPLTICATNFCQGSEYASCRKKTKNKNLNKQKRTFTSSITSSSKNVCPITWFIGTIKQWPSVSEAFIGTARYDFLPMEIIRCLAILGFSKQNRHVPSCFSLNLCSAV